MKKKSCCPCFDCTSRAAGCHGVCAAYAQFDAIHKQKKQVIAEAKAKELLCRRR